MESHNLKSAEIPLSWEDFSKAKRTADEAIQEKDQKIIVFLNGKDPTALDRMLEALDETEEGKEVQQAINDANVKAQDAANLSVEIFRQMASSQPIDDTIKTLKEMVNAGLIPQDADIDAKNENGDTAIHGVLNNTLKMQAAMTLLHWGAALDVENSSGHTVLDEHPNLQKFLDAGIEKNSLRKNLPSVSEGPSPISQSNSHEIKRRGRSL